MAEAETTAADGLAGQAPTAGGPAVAVERKPVKPSLADVLAKIDRGETLTHQERGVLGASKRKAKAKVMDTPPATNQLLETPPAAVPASPAPAAPGVVATDNEFLEAETPAAVPAGAGLDTFFTPENCQMAAEAILDSVDIGTQMAIGVAAEQADCDANTVAKYESAVALRERNRKLMVAGSEPIIRALCRWFKCTPEQLPEVLKKSQFVAGAVCQAFVVTAAFRSLRQSQAEKQQQKQGEPKP
jgi:hypothetical protein